MEICCGHAASLPKASARVTPSFEVRGHGAHLDTTATPNRKTGAPACSRLSMLFVHTEFAGFNRVPSRLQAGAPAEVPRGARGHVRAEKPGDSSRSESGDRSPRGLRRLPSFVPPEL